MDLELTEYRKSMIRLIYLQADLRMKKGLSLDPSINVALVLSGVVICKVTDGCVLVENIKFNDLCVKFYLEKIKSEIYIKRKFYSI